MRLLAVTFIISMLAGQALAEDQYTRGYYRSNGTYVQGYHHTAPDGDPYNNYSTRGNVNPYTGQPGYVNPNPSGPYPYQPVNRGMYGAPTGGMYR